MDVQQSCANRPQKAQTWPAVGWELPGEFRVAQSSHGVAPLPVQQHLSHLRKKSKNYLVRNQILRPHPKAVESETLGWGPAIHVFSFICFALFYFMCPCSFFFF